jgi:hypothetical protein
MKIFSDMGYSFPLFQAPIDHAVIDKSGGCTKCEKYVEILFSEHCYECFCAGVVDAVMDTEFGMVTIEEANKGRTHGIPLNNPSELSDYHLTAHSIDPNFPDEQWFHVHFDKEYLHELLRTPKYSTWQGESWLFCCRRPMVFRGSIPASLLDYGSESLEQSIHKFLQNTIWESATAGGEESHMIYAFTCEDCKNLRFHEDND